MKAMLFAAGLGTRLKPLTDTIPKALVQVNGKTLLEHNLCYLQRFGIHEVIVNVHHFAEKIEEALTANKNFGSSVTISDERAEVLETGGGLKKAAPFFNGETAFVLMNVDVLTDLDLGKLIAQHRADTCVATLAVMNRESSRHFLFNNEMTLCGWVNNKTNERRISRDVSSLRPFAFSGIQVLAHKAIENMPFEGKFSLVDLYLHLAKNNVIRGYDHTGDIFIDVGKPESLNKAADLFK